MFLKENYTPTLHEVIQNDDSSYVSAGWWNDVLDLNHQYACLVKMDSYGDTLWTKLYGQSNDVIVFSLDKTSSGGYILAGYTYDGKAYLINTDANGDTLWTRNMGGALPQDVANQVRSTYDGGFIFVGSTQNFGTGIYVTKTDSSGEAQWSKVFRRSINDAGISICQTADSGYVVVGLTHSIPSNSDIVLIKMNSFGDTLWTKTFGNSLQNYVSNIQETYNHCLVVSGTQESKTFIIITDSLGNFLWSKGYTGSGGYIHGTNISQTSDSGYVLTGYSNIGVTTNAPLVLKTDSNGEVLWSKVYTNNDNYSLGWSIKQSNDGGYIMAGRGNVLTKITSVGSSICPFENAPIIISNHPFNSLYDTLEVTIVNTENFPNSTMVRSGIQLTDCNSVGLNENASSILSVDISPNPSNGIFSVKFSEVIKAGKIEIYNVFGNKVCENELIQEDKKEIALNHLCSGLYFINVLVGENAFFKRILINTDL